MSDENTLEIVIMADQQLKCYLMWASKMAKPGQVRATKPDDLSSIFGTHAIDKEN